MKRNSNGQFAKGQTGNPKGRPKKAREERYLKILKSSCTFKEWRKIIEQAVIDASAGDTQARKWLSDNLIGPPAERMIHSGDQDSPVLFQDVSGVDFDKL